MDEPISTRADIVAELADMARHHAPPPAPVDLDDLDDWRRGDPADHVEAADEESLRSAARAIIGAYLDALPDWHADAACRDLDAAIFFPPSGTRPTEALQVCGRCPVRTECADHAIADPDCDVGVWGGLTVSARRQRRRTMQRGTQ